MRRTISVLHVAMLLTVGSGSLFAQVDYVWTGSVSSDWHTAANWSPPAVPDAGDSATINGNIVSVNSNVVVGCLNLNGGTLQGAATLTVSNLTWTAGGMGGGGTTLIPEGGTAVLSGYANKEFSAGVVRVVENRGTLTWGGAGQITDYCGVCITNYGRFEVQTNAILQAWRGAGSETPPPVFENYGVFEKTAGSGETTWGGYFNNHGVARILSGSLHCGGTSSGRFEVATNSVLSFYTSQLLPSASLTGDGAVEVKYASLVCASTNMLATIPTWTFNSGWITFQTPCAMRTMTVDGGSSVTFQAAATVGAMTLARYTTLGGAGVVTITNLSWYGGVMTDGGTTLIPEGGTAVWSGPENKDFNVGRVVENRGTLTWSGPGQVTDYCGVHITNYGRFEVQSDAMFGSWSQSQFDNYGVFEKTGGSGEKIWGGNFNNHGTVCIRSGLVSFGQFFQTAGLFELAGGDAKSWAFELRGGELRGAGTLTGNVINNAMVSPGASAGRLTIQGDYTQNTNGVLNLELGGLAAGTEHDQLVVTGSAFLDGKVRVGLLGFAPRQNDRFQVLTSQSRAGSFAAIESAPPGLPMAVEYPTNDVVLVANETIVGPTAYTWNGSVSSDWFQQANWTPPGVPGAADTAVVQNGILLLARSVSISNLNFQGRLSGSGSLRVLGTARIGHGTLEGSGVLSIASNAVVRIDSSVEPLQLSRTLINDGTILVDGSQGILESSFNLHDFIVNNGTWEVLYGSFLGVPRGGFTNRGAFICSDTNRVSGFGGFDDGFRNEGLVDVRGGTLRVDAGHLTGWFHAASNAVLQLEGLTVEAGATIESAGEVQSRGTIFKPGSACQTERLSLMYGQNEFQNPVRASSLVIRAATNIFLEPVTVNQLQIDIFAAVTIKSLTSTNMQIAGNCELRGGGTVNIPEGGTLLIGTNASVYLDHVTLRNAGSALLQSGRVLGDMSSLVENTGLWEMHGSAATWVGLINSGRLVSDSWVGSYASGMVWTNLGTVEITGGYLGVGTTFIQTSGSTWLKGGRLDTQILDLRGGVLGGVGTVMGDIINRSEVRPGQPLGVLTNIGHFTQTCEGRLRFTLGGLAPGTEHSQLKITGSAMFDGWIQACSTDGYVPAASNVFHLITCNGRSGGLGNLTDDPLFTGLRLLPKYTSTAVDLWVALAPPEPTPVISNPLTPAGFNLAITGIPGRPFVIEVSEDLVVWIPVYSNTVPPAGVLQFLDAGAVNLPRRYYRTSND